VGIRFEGGDISNIIEWLAGKGGGVMDGLGRLEERVAALEQVLPRLDALEKTVARTEKTVSEMGKSVLDLVSVVLPRLQDGLAALRAEVAKLGEARPRRAGKPRKKSNWPDCDNVRGLWAEGFRSYNVVSKLTGLPFSTVRRYCMLKEEELELLRAAHLREERRKAGRPRAGNGSPPEEPGAPDVR
jgi:uncharacterized coiled-coil protein SlyX